ncbi:MAG: LysR family transcriptional regulator [Devosiaceae bacterium]|nr:LysR family transcriptional regulator [Devosiaceae bacterium MH13]
MRKLPPLHALRAFEAAARHMNFGRAADELALTPTAISHQVRSLEEHLGCQLFIRFPRPMKLTPQGETLFPVLRDGLNRFAEAIEGLTEADAGTLTLSVNLSFASRWLMPRLPRLQKETGFEITVDADDRMVDLHARTVDCAIRYTDAVPREFQGHQLFGDAMIPVCTPAFLEAHGQPSSLAQVARLPLIQFKWKSKRANAPSWERWFAHAAISEPDAGPLSPNYELRLSEELHALEAATAGHGVSLASSLEVRDDIAAGKLVQAYDVGLPGLTFWMVHLKPHRRQAEIEAVVAWMRQEAEKT